MGHWSNGGCKFPNCDCAPTCAFPQVSRDPTYRPEREGEPCTYCGVRMSYFGARQHIPTVDHVQPLSRGGADHPLNLVLCCEYCNTWKHYLTLAEWLEKLLEKGELTRADRVRQLIALIEEMKSE